MSTPADLFTDILARFESTGASADVTHYVLSLGAQDTRGVYAESYAAGTTVSMPIYTKATQRLLVGSGVALKGEYMGITNVAVAAGDKIKDAANLYYRVLSVTPYPWGDVICFYTCELSHNPFAAL